MNSQFAQPLREMKVGAMEVAQKRLVKKLIDSGLHLKFINPTNYNRYCIILFKEKRIMLMYKREFFLSFGTIFRDEGEKGVGDTINCEDLKTALSFRVKEIYSTFPDGACYKISMEDFLKDSYKWVVKEGKEVRSISIHKYKKEFDLSE